MPDLPVAIITGSSRGIGAATAKLAAEAGFAVCINYLKDEDSAKEVLRSIVQADGRSIAVQADVSNEVDVIRLFKTAYDELGPIKALVANAGMTGRLGRFSNIELSTLQRVIDVNLLGCLLCNREAVRYMSTIEGGSGGSIVNVSSVAAATGSPGEYVHYAATKAGVESFSAGLAKEVASEGIRVNAVSPGSTMTDIHASAGDPDRPARIAGKIPLGRLAHPMEIANAIAWLISDKASYVSGSIVRVAGGI